MDWKTLVCLLVGGAGAVASVNHLLQAYSPDTPGQGVGRDSALVDQQLVNKVKSRLRDEPEVVDILFERGAEVRWVVAVSGRGKHRIRYAWLVCNTLHKAGVSLIQEQVQVVDFYRFVHNKGNSRLASLGTVACDVGSYKRGPD